MRIWLAIVLLLGILIPAPDAGAQSLVDNVQAIQGGADPSTLPSPYPTQPTGTSPWLPQNANPATDSTTQPATGTSGWLPEGASPAVDNAAAQNGGQCDFTAMKESLYGTESAGSGGYTAIGPNTRYGKPLGKYQFIPPTQESMMNKNPQCNGAGCHGNAILQQQCWGVQECLMDALIAENLDRAKRNPNCQALVGTTISASGNRGACTKQITWSGIAAAYHLGGADACDNVKANGVGDTDGHTSEAYYMCYHSGVALPGECEVQPYDPDIAAPTLTNQQVEVLTNSGDEGFINTGGSIKDSWVAGLMLMAEQFSVNMIKQLEGIGMAFDAKEQLETERLIQQKTAEAHKDYQPSEQMCTFGTFSRDLATTQRSADLTRDALSHEVLQRELGSGDSKGNGLETDSLSRIARFRKNFCNPGDDANGLQNLCPEPAEPSMQNADINYTQSIDSKLTLDVNLTDDEITTDEETIFALVDNLFMHDPLPRIPEKSVELQQYQYHYMNMRSIIAMRGVARNSLANIIALKTAAPESGNNAGPYLKALIKEMGVKDEEIEHLLGEHPSYYAQMELLTKTIYQSPNFYANLYDKPANVERIRATMQAIKLMNDRDIHASLLRREMLLSMILELRLRQSAEKVYSATEQSMFR